MNRMAELRLQLTRVNAFFVGCAWLTDWIAQVGSSSWEKALCSLAFSALLWAAAKCCLSLSSQSAKL